MKAYLLNVQDENIYEKLGYEDDPDNYKADTILGYDRDNYFFYMDAEGKKGEFKTGYFRKKGLRKITKRDMARIPFWST
ncbi:hypothetical protein [Pseudescherichia sp.]|uniref:hypothetical protein n=1 Tax=Pseudescherichia sp. TaxID=2055881 RepID=UPI0028A9848E|nr:hypothetical protein [Pseudescherichia sp.]